MSTNEQAIKGVNRCDAISYQELLDADPLPSPEFLRREGERDYGFEPVPADRYTSQEFFDREVKALWLRTWQYVCREEQLLDVGDSHVFDLLGHSVIVVRQRDGTLKALRNVCLHRGRKLMTMHGCRQEIRCPYHGFTWGISGRFVKNPMKWDFPGIDETKFNLPEVRVDSWGGFIFVNFDADAPALASVADPLSKHFEHWQIRDCYQKAHVAKVVPANWKVVVEAFLESHHALTTHPQISPYTGDANTQYDVLTEHVCRFITPLGTPSPLIDNTNLAPADIVRKWFERGSRNATPGSKSEIRDGQSAREYAADLARKSLSARTGRDYSKACQTDLIDAISYHLFPAFSIWGGLSTHIGYRWRPWQSRVDSTLLEVYLFEPAPLGTEHPAPAPMRFLSEDEPWHSAPELGYLGPVFDQDQSNFGPVQQGLRDLGDGVIQMGRYSEVRCRHLHHMIDRYIESYERKNGIA